MNALRSLTKFYGKLSNFGKLAVLIAALLCVVVFFKSIMPKKEGMTDRETFLYKEGDAAYDDFYSNVYDFLVFNTIKNDYEVGTIINKTAPDETSIIADIGCGTGHQVANLASKNLQVIGVDISPAMIEKAKESYPYYNFKVGNALDNGLFNFNSLTHITCLYFTIYYFKDKRQFFYNCMDWLMPGGYLIVHIVDREKFDPILPPGNPLYIVSPQKYAKERITKTQITFNDFVYNANFNLEPESDVATFDEKFKFNDGKVRKQQQKLYMESAESIVGTAQDCGFILQGKSNMVKCAYENQYLYIFQKPG
jgi:SAM-dependent methyltransferase